LKTLLKVRFLAVSKPELTDRICAQLSSDLGLDRHDPQLSEALRQDEKLIAKHIVSVIQSPDAIAAVMHLQDDDAQNFMDVVQNVTD
jgi:hypothetical protein